MERGQGMAGRFNAGPGLDFNNDDLRAFSSENINFSERCAYSPAKNTVILAAQILARPEFADFSDSIGVPAAFFGEHRARIS